MFFIQGFCFKQLSYKIKTEFSRFKILIKLRLNSYSFKSLWGLFPAFWTIKLIRLLKKIIQLKDFQKLLQNKINVIDRQKFEPCSKRIKNAITWKSPNSLWRTLYFSKLKLILWVDLLLWNWHALTKTSSY